MTCLCVFTARVTALALAEEYRPRMIGSGTNENHHGVQPAEVAARQSSSTGKAKKIGNRHECQIETHPNRIRIDQTATLSHSVCHVHTLSRHSGSFAILQTEFQYKRSRVELSSIFEKTLMFRAFSYVFQKHRSYFQPVTKKW